VRKIQDVSEASQYEMAAALSSGDERAIRLVGLKAEAETLYRLKGAHEQTQRRLFYDKRSAEHDIETTERRINELKEAKEKVPDYISNISGKVGKKEFDNREEFGKAVLRAYNAGLNNKNNRPGVSHEIATLNGIPMKLRCVKQGWTQKDEDLSYNAKFVVEVTDKVDFDIAEGGPFVIEDGDGKALTTKAVNDLNRISTLIAKQENQLRNKQDELKKIKARLGAPFESEQELRDKIAEIAQLERELLEEGENLTEAETGAEKEKYFETLREQAKESWEDYKGEEDLYQYIRMRMGILRVACWTLNTEKE